MPEIREFYDAFTPRFEEAIDYCDKFPLDDLLDKTDNWVPIVGYIGLVGVLTLIGLAIGRDPDRAEAEDASLRRINPAAVPAE